ncbi:related to DUS3-member of dihydrouridine synthase family, partial [Serendipita indica DSM 11827]
MTSTGLPKGTAPIKREYLVDAVPLVSVDVTVVASNGAVPLAGSTRKRSEMETEDEIVSSVAPKEPAEGKDGDGATEDADGEPPTKKVKLSGAQRRKLAKEEKRNKTGQNKGRRFQRVHDEQEICWKIACGLECPFGEKCRASHDLAAYLLGKPSDIFFPTSLSLSSSPPFVHVGDVDTEGTEAYKAAHPFIDLCPGASTATRCTYFEEYGECKANFKCRFLGAHLQYAPVNGEGGHRTLSVRANPERIEWAKAHAQELNMIQPDTAKSLRKREYKMEKTDEFRRILKEGEGKSMSFRGLLTKRADKEDEGDMAEDRDDETKGGSDVYIIERPEKKRLHWKDLTYLAPLTTVGNLPFRRLCTTLGVDITCGEMGLSHSFLQGSKEEWSLVRRHPSERIFGVQIAGNKPEQTTACADVIGNECSSIDFVDLNAGCPIDLVYQAGSGSALLNTAGKMGKCLIGMNYALGDVPVTLKMRTGVKDGFPTAHKLMPRLHDWAVGSVTLHGRSRQQRYTRLADWEYIKSCVQALRAHEATLADAVEGIDADVAMRSSGGLNYGFGPIPFWGNGDCFSGLEYWKTVEATGVDGIMIGRGALIKPWIFTEIKERRDWDISSRERLDLIRK